MSENDYILYLGGLNKNVEEAYLFNVFKKFGRIETLKIMRNAVTHESRNFGFIQFFNRESVIKAQKEMCYQVILGDEILAFNKRDFISSKNRIKIQNILDNIYRKALRKELQNFGDILFFEIRQDGNLLSNKYYADVTYADSTSIEKCLKALNGKEILGSPLLAVTFKIESAVLISMNMTEGYWKEALSISENSIGSYIAYDFMGTQKNRVIKLVTSSPEEAFKILKATKEQKKYKYVNNIGNEKDIYSKRNHRNTKEYKNYQLKSINSIILGPFINSKEFKTSLKELLDNNSTITLSRPNYSSEGRTVCFFSFSEEKDLMHFTQKTVNNYLPICKHLVSNYKLEINPATIGKILKNRREEYKQKHFKDNRFESNLPINIFTSNKFLNNFEFFNSIEDIYNKRDSFNKLSINDRNNIYRQLIHSEIKKQSLQLKELIDVNNSNKINLILDVLMNEARIPKANIEEGLQQPNEFKRIIEFAVKSSI